VVVCIQCSYGLQDEKKKSLELLRLTVKPCWIELLWDCRNYDISVWDQVLKDTGLSVERYSLLKV